MTPEEEQAAQEQLQQQAAMQSAVLRGQPYAMPPGESPMDADVMSSIGSALAGLGGPAVNDMSDNLTHRADALRVLAMKRAGTKNKAIEAAAGMEQAVKDKFPDVWGRLQGQGLSDSAWSRVYQNENSNARVDTTQTNINNRFTKDFGLRNTKQSADLGARTVYGAHALDPTNPRPLSQEEATELGKASGAYRMVAQKTAEAKKIYGGKTPLPGTMAAGKIKQLITEVYGPLLQTTGIGSLTQGHQHLLDQMLKDPSGDWRTYFNDQYFPTLLDSLERGAKENLEARANGVGQSFAVAPSHPTMKGGAPETKVIGGKTYMKKPNGKWAVKE